MGNICFQINRKHSWSISFKNVGIKAIFRKTLPQLVLTLVLFVYHFEVLAQDVPVNYDESKIANYTLPDPLIMGNGERITTADKWTQVQRPALLALFKEHVFGMFPGKPEGLHFRLNSVDTNALGGRAIRKEVTIYFTSKEEGPSMELLLYLPKHTSSPVPVFTGLNFCGNHCITNDSGITLSARWMQNTSSNSVVNNRATDLTRGSSSSRWPVDEIIRRGYGLATAYYGDLEPDHAEGWKAGIRTTLKSEPGINEQEWSAMGAWAWGLSRIMDYMETDNAINAKQVVLTGHSRLGKAALWAAANDTRFSIVVSNNSGEGGAALARRWYGETTEKMNKSFPHWFNTKFKTYNGNEQKLPVDQHILLSLLAPRPLYVASAEDDEWADPKGEFLGLKNAEPVYALFNKKGLGVSNMPPVNQPVGENLRYHIRTGKHDITRYDWEQYLNFADRHFNK